MNCAACNQPINRFGGYYLVGNSPYCSNCFKGSLERCTKIPPTRPLAVDWKHDNLLEAFRAYQERERQSVCRVY